MVDVLASVKVFNVPLSTSAPTENVSRTTATTTPKSASPDNTARPDNVQPTHVQVYNVPINNSVKTENVWVAVRMSNVQQDNPVKTGLVRVIPVQVSNVQQDRLVSQGRVQPILASLSPAKMAKHVQVENVSMTPALQWSAQQDRSVSAHKVIASAVALVNRPKVPPEMLVPPPSQSSHLTHQRNPTRQVPHLTHPVEIKGL